MCKLTAVFLLSWCFCITAVAQKDSVRHTNFLVLPVIAKSIETGWSGGAVGSVTFRLHPKDTISRTSNMQLLALYSLKKQLILAINGAQYSRHEKYILSEQVSFSSFPDKFWGLGKYTKDNDYESYKYKQFYIYLHLMRKLGHHFFIGGLFERQQLSDVEHQAGGLFDQQQIVGRNGYTVAGLGMSFTYDTRNHAFAPNKGGFAQLYFNHFDKHLFSDYNYTNIVIDLRKYIAFGNNVLALQAYSFGNTGNEVPLRSLALLGGSNSMRGYYAGRFRYTHQMVFQSEYRFPIYRRFGAVAFGGLGDVGNSFTDYSFGDFKYSVGAGLRFALMKSDKLNLRLDYGVGQGNNSGLYFQLGEAF
ncbi:Surface antigen [Hydrobacter penzbergensis]|uniref:Surface antigen n=1 Tax=Hydrobacter penzbergensis TaxID=1235997 RepID=A0A8X8LEU7_9BACT|nr:BamA/TamA family outer membrane protein [Hydrobacter penzbergensis]SDX40116.1 Surface antigen [Hydrobacter penzbergensis]